MPTKAEFVDELQRLLTDASNTDMPALVINSGELHRDMGGYPAPKHQMPSCCDAMYELMRPEDSILRKPPKGKGASLTIRYKLPR